MHVGKQFTRMAGVRPHQPRSPARPSALVRTNAHGRQTRTPVRSYDARDCREEGSEIGFPSHTAMSRNAPTEVLLTVLGAHSSLTPSGTASSSARACGGTTSSLPLTHCLQARDVWSLWAVWHSGSAHQPGCRRPWSPRMTRAMERLATGAKKLTSTWKPELGADDRDYSGNAIPRRWFMCGCSSTLGRQFSS